MWASAAVRNGRHGCPFAASAFCLLRIQTGHPSFRPRNRPPIPTSRQAGRPGYISTRTRVRFPHLPPVISCCFSPHSLFSVMSSPVSGGGRSRVLDWLEEVMNDPAPAPPAAFESHREDLGDGEYIIRYEPAVLHRLDVGNRVEIQVVSSEAPPLDTIHTRDGSTVRIISGPLFWSGLRREHRIHGRDEEEEDANSNNRKRARVPASSKAVLCLKEVSAADAAAEAECAVCLQDFVAEDKVSCSHAFHEKCIFKWLRVNHVCPLCRHALPTHQDDDDEDWMPASMPVREGA
ncbi:unnamed protein product [Urochloa humidicola]